LKERGDDKLQEALIGKILLTTLLPRSSVVMAVAKTLTGGHEHKHLSNYACCGLPKLRQELVQATINYLCGEKPGAGNHNAAWAADTGKVSCSSARREWVRRLSIFWGGRRILLSR
jgi:hypothetical protein